MKIKRKYAHALSGLLFVSLIITSFGSIRADNPPGPYSVYGYVTLNGNPAPDNVTVILSIQNRSDHSGHTHDNGKYTVDFDAAQGETASFTVNVSGQYVHPTNILSFKIKHPSPYPYFINLSVNATQNQNENQGGGGGGTSNTPPIADLSAGEPYQGLVGEPILFDGSRSHDPDGSIVSYQWMFGDGNTGTGKTAMHTYTIADSFTAVLTVTDNQGATGSDTTTVTITLANLPPSQPTLSGPHKGVINTTSAYTATSTDPENSTLFYTFAWGDGLSNTTGAEVSGTPVTFVHTWGHAGIYNLSVTASDGETSSAPATMTVLMSVEYVGDLGYLIDTNGDGIYDAFYSNATGLTTPVQRLADGTYLIDSDGSGTWDHLYNPETKELTLYTENISGGNGISKNGISNAVLLLAGILGAILVLFLILLALTRTTRKQDQTPAKPVEKKSDSSNSTKRKPGKKTVNK